MSDQIKQDDALDDVLRGFPIESVEADEEALPSLPQGGPFETENNNRPVRFTVKPENEPQDRGTKYYVVDEDTGTTHYAGKVLKYGSRRGLSRSSTLLKYDRFDAEQIIGAWAHFMWPSVMAESNGRYISINAWDRAHLTWGFYQLAAHTARDNLILLMRELVQLPSAARYFPDLTLLNGKVARQTDAGPVSLEREEEVDVGSWTETQIPDFMAYLNPSSYRVDEGEVLTAAKFATWALNDKAMRDATVRVSVEIMKRKIKTRAHRYGLIGKRPELALWVSDMFHHGRGSASQVRHALSLPTFEKQLDALSKIDTTGRHTARLNNVKRYVQLLLDEKRFNDVRFGEGVLSFDAGVA